jgi:hypothetical protein
LPCWLWGDTTPVGAADDLIGSIPGPRLPNLWSYGIQWLVPILQKLEENGAIDNSVRSQAALPGGSPTALDPYAADLHFLVDFNERYSTSHHGRRRMKN